MSRYTLPIAVLGGLLALQGCGASLAVMAAKAESERLENLRAWEKDIAAMDCAGLAGEHETLEAARDDMVDYDQRRDTLDDVLEQKGCPDPAA